MHIKFVLIKSLKYYYVELIIKFFINKYSINNKIFICGTSAHKIYKIKTSKYIPSKNQLFIDKVDHKFNKHINSFLNLKKLKRKVKKVSNNVYKMNNKLSKNIMNIYFDIKCEKLDSIYIQNDEYDLFIRDIKIDTLSIAQINSLLNLNLNDDKIEIYDFR